MLGTTFSHGTLRSYIVAFGTLFNNIKITRSNATGVKQTVAVPISYAPKERWMARLDQDPDIHRDVGIVLPRMSYELVSTTYAPDRKLNTMQKVSLPSVTNPDKSLRVFSSVPYDFSFTLGVYARNNADASAIIEQILPFFTPEFTITIKNMTDVGIDVDAPIVLNSINKEDLFEGAFEERRAIVWTLDFTMKAQFYGPNRESNIIKQAYVDFFDARTRQVETGTARSGGSSPALNKIQLANTASAVDNFYSGSSISITAGPIAGNVRTIIGYTGLTRIAEVDSAYTLTPNTQSTYSIELFESITPSAAITTSQQAGAAVLSRITVEPGLTVEGLPTTSKVLTIDASDINANDDFGYITTTQVANTTGGIPPLT